MGFVKLVSRIPDIIRGGNEGTALVVQKTAFDIQAGCEWRSRVDTGQMRAGWRTEILGPFTAEVFNPVEHSIYNEEGTESMPAQPMLTPSVEEAWPGFQAGISQAWG